MSLDLEPTTKVDLDFVLRAENAPENASFIGSWVRSEHEQAIGHPKYWHQLIKKNGENQGYMIAIDLRYEGYGIFLKRIVVVSKARGIGRQAIQAFVSSLSILDPPHIWLAVSRDNFRAQRSYAAVGFHENPVTPEVRGELQLAVAGFGDDSMLMFKTLDSSSILQSD